MKFIRVLSAAAVAAVLGAGSAAAQGPPAAALAADSCASEGLTLDEAVALALEGNRTLGATRERARAARAGADAADAFLLPTVGGEAGLMRSDDPVAAFGMRLRQGRFTETDFDLRALNRPDAVSDWTGALGVTWDALDPAAWVGRDAARARARAAELGADRSAEAVVYRTRILYLDAARAAGRLDAAVAGELAARAARNLLERRRAAGLLTDADVLRGEAALADARARVVEAERVEADALGVLALHLGLDPAVELTLAPVFASNVAPPAEDAALPANRSDLRASAAALDASRAEARRARAARLPTVSLVAGLSSHAPGAFDDRETNATLGVQLRIPLFTGGALSAQEEASGALAAAAALEHEDALARARHQVLQARRGVVSAGEGLTAATAAAEAAEEARRLVRRRFEEGMATTADLLQAEAEAIRLRTAAVDAEAGLAMAGAALAFALGAEDAGTPRGSQR